MEEKEEKIISRTLEVWQPRTSGRLTEEDARQIGENFIGFFQLLLEWESMSESPAPAAGSLTT